MILFVGSLDSPVLELCFRLKTVLVKRNASEALKEIDKSSGFQ